MALLLSITIFVAFGAGFVFINMAVGSFVRPQIPNPEKSSIYECGEPSIGSSWVQFDLRFYIVALVFLIFDVEVRSEEHTSELQSRGHLVCRLLLEKKNQSKHRVLLHQHT